MKNNMADKYAHPNSVGGKLTSPGRYIPAYYNVKATCTHRAGFSLRGLGQPLAMAMPPKTPLQSLFLPQTSLTRERERGCK